jgi:dTDP-4-dehydrorhamnose reductase
MNKTYARILVLGATGMLGSAMLRLFSESGIYQTYGTVRSARAAKYLPESVRENLISGVDVENHDSLVSVFAASRPDLVINCVGLVKQLAAADDALSAIPINALLPHRLARLCELSGARLIHMSTDCVFSGKKGMYTEEDVSDAYDIYGRSKYLGEVDYPHAITLRTSIIGHELEGSRSLINWFLSQQKQVRGFTKAIFSGLPTVEIARLIRDHVIPHPELHGVYNVSADPINKFDLLSLVAEIYGKKIDILPDENFKIDRSLDSSRFRAATAFSPKAWPDLVRSMYDFS